MFGTKHSINLGNGIEKLSLIAKAFNALQTILDIKYQQVHFILFFTIPYYTYGCLFQLIEVGKIVSGEKESGKERFPWFGIP
jgi:hypothetical protein